VREIKIVDEEEGNKNCGGKNFSLKICV